MPPFCYFDASKAALSTKPDIKSVDIALNMHQQIANTAPVFLRTSEDSLWTTHPTERALLRCIELEELSLTYRLCRSRFGFVDHEPSYHQKYSHPTDPRQVPNSWFNIWFSANFPTQTIQYRRHYDFKCYQTYDDPESPYPSREPVLLCANVNTVVWLRTEVLMNIYPLPPRTKRQLELRQYLIALWSTTPQDFPSLEQPSGLLSLEYIQDQICPPNLKSPDVKTAKWHSDLLWAQTVTMPSLSLYHFYGFSLASRSSLQQSFMYVLLYLTESFQLTDFCSSCTSSYLSRPTRERSPQYQSL